MTYGDTVPGLKTVTLPPVIGKTSEPSTSLASPTTPGVSLSEARASVKPLSRAMAVSLPVRASIAATGLGAEADVLSLPLAALASSSVPQAASGTASRATVGEGGEAALGGGDPGAHGELPS